MFGFLLPPTHIAVFDILRFWWGLPHKYFKGTFDKGRKMTRLLLLNSRFSSSIFFAFKKEIEMLLSGKEQQKCGISLSDNRGAYDSRIAVWGGELLFDVSRRMKKLQKLNLKPSNVSFFFCLEKWARNPGEKLHEPNGFWTKTLETQSPNEISRCGGRRWQGLIWVAERRQEKVSEKHSKELNFTTEKFRQGFARNVFRQ